MSSSAPDKKPAPALRIVHLRGGLQAFDLEEPEITIGLNGLVNPLRISRPPYPSLYRELTKLGLEPIGVHFVTDDDDLSGFAPARWQSWRTPQGLRGKDITQEWSQVRSTYARKGDIAVAPAASTITTYLRLLDVRLYQLSVAYHAMLRFHMRRRKGQSARQPGLFSNVWSQHLNAAVHGFLADAGSLRDALAEATWRLVLKRTTDDVATMRTLMKRSKDATEPLLVEMRKATADGGWIKNLSDLRNEIIHVVPLAGAHEHGLFELREIDVAGGKLPHMHYPLANLDGSLRRPPARTVDYSNDAEILQSIQDYQAFATSSIDALDYARRTLAQLMTLAEQVRLAAGLKGEMLHFTDADLVGPVEFFED
jgi:hypothetical protein